MPYEQPGVILSNLSPTNKESEVYETAEAEHEYEILDKYSQPQHDDVSLGPKTEEPAQLQPLSSTGDYEFTQCPAYVPVATTSIHDNSNKPAEISSTQLTTAH